MGRPTRDVAIQLIWRTSSSGEYSRTVSNSVPRPRRARMRPSSAERAVRRAIAMRRALGRSGNTVTGVGSSTPGPDGRARAAPSIAPRRAARRGCPDVGPSTWRAESARVPRPDPRPAREARAGGPAPIVPSPASRPPRRERWPRGRAREVGCAWPVGPGAAGRGRQPVPGPTTTQAARTTTTGARGSSAATTATSAMSAAHQRVGVTAVARHVAGPRPARGLNAARGRSTAPCAGRRRAGTGRALPRV